MLNDENIETLTFAFADTLKQLKNEKINKEFEDIEYWKAIMLFGLNVATINLH